MIVFQHIVTVWTKRTRGAEGRELRARLPTSYPVPDGLLTSVRRCARHWIRRHESDGYVAMSHEESYDRLRVTDALTLVESAAALAVTFHGDSGACGRPRRENGELSLARGQRLEVRFNGRHQSFDDPWYEDHIVHVAFDICVSTGMFAGAPDLVLDRRVDLW